MLAKLKCRYAFIFIAVFAAPTFAQINQPGTATGPLWNRIGTVLWPRTDLTVDGKGTGSFGLQEVSVMYDTSGNCPVLGAGYGTGCWRMWVHCGFTNNNICLAEGADPLNFIRAAGAVAGLTANQYATPVVFKSGSIYYFIGQTTAGNFDLWTSSDGATWSGKQSSVLAIGSAGQWDASSLNNPSVVTNGPTAGTWYMLYEGRGTGCTHSCIGSATSTNSGVTWTKGGSNPLSTLQGYGGPDLHFINGTWYAYMHTGSLPSDIWISSSQDFVNWTVPAIVLQRAGLDEGGPLSNSGGPFNSNAQIADPFVMEAPCFAFWNTAAAPAKVTSSNLCSYMFYEAIQTQTAPFDAHIKMAVAWGPNAQVITASATSQEGAHKDINIMPCMPDSNGSTGQIFCVPPFYWMSRTTTNTDSLITLTYSAATAASYSFQSPGITGGTNAPRCFITPVNPGAITFTVTTLTNATLTVTASGSFTGSVSALCIAQN